MTTRDAPAGAEGVAAIAGAIRDEIARLERAEWRAPGLDGGAGLESEDAFGTGLGFPAGDGDAAERLPELRWQPDFEPAPDRRYSVGELLRYHDEAFVSAAYRAVLERPPDPTGFRYFVTALREAQLSKVEILARLRYSPEGRRRRVRIAGLLPLAAVRHLGRVPVLGYGVRWLAGVLMLPVHLRHQEQAVAYLLAQHGAAVNHANESARRVWGRVQAVRPLHRHARETRTMQARADAAMASLGEGARVLADEMERARRDVDELSARLGALEAIRRAAEITDDELYVALEEAFRGTRDQIRARVSTYVEPVQAAGAGTAEAPVLDLGCGRGEWLEVLRDQGLTARGVDLNARMVEDCRVRGLNVLLVDALEHLRSLPAGSLGAVTALHLVEHLGPATLVALLDEIARVLRPGGLAVLETPNPRNVRVSTLTFHLDFTHRRPIPSQLLAFLAEARGLADVRVVELHPPDLPPIDEPTEVARRFNDAFLAPLDYAVLARKPAS